MSEKEKSTDNNRKLFFTFLRIGAFTFGGGYAMIPLIQKEIVEKEKWITEEDLLEIIAIAESTPGPIAINAATFVGYRVGGFRGSVSATSGVSIPSFVIILILARVLKAVEQFQVVSDAFVGIRAAVLALILSAFLKLFGGMEKSAFNLIVSAAAFVAVVFGDANVLAVLAACAAAGLLHSFMVSRRKGANGRGAETEGTEGAEKEKERGKRS